MHRILKIGFMFCMTIVACDSQRISLEENNATALFTSCVRGVQVNDTFYFSGLLDASNTDPEDWPRFASFFLRESPSLPYYWFCDLDCRFNVYTPTSSTCECFLQDDSMYSYTIEGEATLSLSKNEIQGTWTNNYGTSSTFTPVRTLPEIFDKVLQTATINSQVFPLTIDHPDTTIHVMYNDTLDLNYCVANVDSQFTISIHVNGSHVQTSYSSCVSMVYNTNSSSVGVNFYFTESSGCHRSIASHVTIVREN
ncbi:uncharacterized protein LOC131931254 [Physella acuta]|uniref:uncharacterized protein LOC131931254 n=1 Tax=Physella acuta TaxID=109671 RepID=UPI0027DE6C92|nr:uncharacterized protein LOC131931254 [Physella acuta]